MATDKSGNKAIKRSQRNGSKLAKAKAVRTARQLQIDIDRRLDWPHCPLDGNPANVACHAEASASAGCDPRCVHD